MPPTKRATYRPKLGKIAENGAYERNRENLQKLVLEQEFLKYRLAQNKKALARARLESAKTAAPKKSAARKIKGWLS